MKRNRHNEEQIIGILKANERGVSVAELAPQTNGKEGQEWPRRTYRAG